MSKIQTFSFGLENRTKFSSDFRRLDFRHSGCSIVRLYYKCPKFESSVGRVDQPTVWEWDNFGKRRNPNVRISDIYCICMYVCINHNFYSALTLWLFSKQTKEVQYYKMYGSFECLTLW